MIQWKMVKKEIEWGAAFEEAQPIMLVHGRTVVVEDAFKAEKGSYVLVLPSDAVLTVQDGRIRATIPQAD